MCALHANLAVEDDTLGERIEDVLVVLDPRHPEPYDAFCRTQLHSAYTSVVFTRNPSLHLNVQQTALLVISLCRAITQLLQARCRTPEQVNVIFSIIYTIRRRARKQMAFWNAILEKFLDPEPGRHMTEAQGDGIASVCQLLGAMCAFPDSPLVAKLLNDKNQLAKVRNCDVLNLVLLPCQVAVALMAESVSREARVKIKTTTTKKKNSKLTDSETAFGLLRLVLNITVRVNTALASLMVLKAGILSTGHSR